MWLLSRLIRDGGRLIGSSRRSGGVVWCRAASAGYLRESYQCDEAWSKRLQSPLLQKVNPDDLFFEMDQKYQADKVLSAVDADIYLNRVTDTEALDEMEEVVYRLRKSPATADTLPSTSHALIRAFCNAQKMDDLIRILNDRLNYGVFLDHHLANILMDSFLKMGNNRDAVKVASLLMLEEDFGTQTSKLFCLVSCLKYLQEPKPEPWEAAEAEPDDDSKDDIKKVRVRFLRNVYTDQHFDLYQPQHLFGKTLAKVGEVVTEDETIKHSAQVLGWAVYGKWDKVQLLMDKLSSTKKPVYSEVLKKVSELVDKALAEVEASPTKTLSKPKLRPLPGMNVEETDVAAFWDRIKFPAYEKILVELKSKLSSKDYVSENKTEAGTMLKNAETLLSSALAEREDEEIADQIKRYEEWEIMRRDELDRQIQRFRAFKLTENIEARKKELKEKEEVIFFFDHEEEWMMKLPPDEQAGYKLSTEYIPSNATPFVKVIPPKKIRQRKSKT